MPSGMAAEMRALVATENITDEELRLAPLSNTGYVGVIEVGLKNQARIQVPGDGPGRGPAEAQRSAASFPCPASSTPPRRRRSAGQRS